jgi:hypothetical protein
LTVICNNQIIQCQNNVLKIIVIKVCFIWMNGHKKWKIIKIIIQDLMQKCFVPTVKGQQATTFYYNAILEWNKLPTFDNLCFEPNRKHSICLTQM